MRVVSGLPSLRSQAVFPAVRRAIAAASRARFRVAHFSVQLNHVHLLVESDDALASGMQGLAIRLAKAVNHALGRHGRVWNDRYHAHALRTPREVRNALIYVLLNGRKHRVAGPGVDPCSSGAWFDGWCVPRSVRIPSPVGEPRSWLLRVGWRRAGSISLDATPAVE